MSTSTLRNIVAATVIGGCGLFASENFWTTTSSSSFLTQAEARYGVGRYGVARYGVARRGYRRAAIAGAVVGGALAAGYGYGYGYGTGYPYYNYATTSPTYGGEYYGFQTGPYYRSYPSYSYGYGYPNYSYSYGYGYPYRYAGLGRRGWW